MWMVTLTGSVEPESASCGSQWQSTWQVETPENRFVEFWGLKMTRDQQKVFESRLKLKEMVTPKAVGSPPPVKLIYHYLNHFLL